jgi:hypothetical protein
MAAPKNEAPVTTDPTQQTVAMTPSDIAKMIEAAVTSAVREMRKPTEEELEKKEKERLKKLADVQADIDHARAVENKKKIARQYCIGKGPAHGALHPNGSFKHSWRSQVHTPTDSKLPFLNPTCERCYYQVGRIYVDHSWITSGANLNEKPNLNLETLEEWKRQSDALAESWKAEKKEAVA